MTGFDDFKKLVKGMKAVYTSQNFLPDADSVKIWYRLLMDIPYEQLNVAIQKHMQTCKFPPTVAELRAAAASVVIKNSDWSEGWEQLARAIRTFGYYRQGEAFASMDELTRRVVKRLGWKELCMSETPMQDRANFRMVYEQQARRVHETAVLSGRLRGQIERLQGAECKAIAEGTRHAE